MKDQPRGTYLVGVLTNPLEGGPDAFEAEFEGEPVHVFPDYLIFRGFQCRKDSDTWLVGKGTPDEFFFRHDGTHFVLGIRKDTSTESNALQANMGMIP